MQTERARVCVYVSNIFTCYFLYKLLLLFFPHLNFCFCGLRWFHSNAGSLCVSVCMTKHFNDDLQPVVFSHTKHAHTICVKCLHVFRSQLAFEFVFFYTMLLLLFFVGHFFTVKKAKLTRDSLFSGSTFSIYYQTNSKRGFFFHEWCEFKRNNKKKM